MKLKLSDLTYINLCFFDDTEEVTQIKTLEKQETNNTNNKKELKAEHEDWLKWEKDFDEMKAEERKYNDNVCLGGKYIYHFCLNNSIGNLITLSSIYSNNDRWCFISNRMYYKGFLPPDLQELEIHTSHYLFLDSLLESRHLKTIVDIPKEYKRKHFLNAGFQTNVYNGYFSLRTLYEFCDECRSEKTKARILENRKLEENIDV